MIEQGRAEEPEFIVWPVDGVPGGWIPWILRIINDHHLYSFAIRRSQVGSNIGISLYINHRISLVTEVPGVR